MSAERYSLFFVLIFLIVQPKLIQNIKDLLAPLAEAGGLFIVDIEIKQSGGFTDVSLYLDGEAHNISLDECAEISREFGFLLDAHNIFDSKYRLNVSSPGLSRPLTDLRQYRKNTGRTVRIRHNADQETRKIQGVIITVTDKSVTIDDGETGPAEVPFDDIIEAKIIPKI